MTKTIFTTLEAVSIPTGSYCVGTMKYDLEDIYRNCEFVDHRNRKRDRFQCLHLSRAIATIGFTVKRGIWKEKGAKIYQFNRQYLEKNL